MGYKSLLAFWAWSQCVLECYDRRFGKVQRPPLLLKLRGRVDHKRIS